MRPALPASAYIALLRRSREPALASLLALVEAEDYAGLSASLVISPFDDWRQAAYFLPWAVLSSDEAAATSLQEAYIAVRAAWKGIDDAAIAAGRGLLGKADVIAAVEAFDRAVAAEEAGIPMSLY